VVERSATKTLSYKMPHLPLLSANLARERRQHEKSKVVCISGLVRCPYATGRRQQRQSVVRPPGHVRTNLQADRIPLPPPPKPEPTGTLIAGGIPSPPPKPKPMGTLPADGIGAATPPIAKHQQAILQTIKELA